MTAAKKKAAKPKTTLHVEADRPLPANLDAERALLGGILIHGELFDRVAPLIHADDFFREAHQHVFRAIHAIVDERKAAPDLVTLRAELARVGMLDAVGGPAYLAALTDGVPRSVNVDHYARLVRETAILRGLIAHGHRIAGRAYDAEDSPAELLAEADRSILDLQRSARGDRLQPLRERAVTLFERLEYRVAHRGELLGIDTGFASINELSFGWQAGDMIIIAARPSIGKTTFVMNSIVTGARTSGRPVAVFSLEMKREQLEWRMLASLSGVPLSRIMGGYLTTADYKAVADAIAVMHDLPIYVDDRSGITAWDIRSACRRLRAEAGLGMVVIDYVQLIAGTLGDRATRNEQVTDISRRVKHLADDLAVPVLLLSQLSRANDKRSDPRPKLSDLRESGSLEQDADLVCFLHRKNHREGGVTNFIIEKQRNGPTGTVNLTLDRDTVTFTDGGEEAPEPAKTEKPKGPKRVMAPKLPHDDDF